MLKRLIVYSMLTAMVNSTVGCSYMAKVRTEEAKLTPDKVGICSVDLHLQMASLKRTDQSWVRFDESGGRFLPDQGVFVGKTADGDSVRIELQRTESVMVFQAYPPGEVVTEISTKAFLMKRQKSDAGIIDTVEPPGQRIEFTDCKGCFSENGLTITGEATDGRNVAIPVKDAVQTWTNEKRFDYFGTFALIGIPVGFIVAFAILYDGDILGGGGGGGWSWF